MNRTAIKFRRLVFFSLVILGLFGCERISPGKSGLVVLFEGRPLIYHENVYYLGQNVGQILNPSSGNGAVYQINVRLLSEFQQNFGKHWVFFVDSGRLHVAKIDDFGEPVAAGDRLCGFGSKAALNWFKLKTLLNDRVYEANLKAENLARRLGS